VRIGPANSSSTDDLKARTRIRDAALEQFAARGFTGATIRGIARAAGVSPGLVQHHFHSKDGLRQACDDRVLELVRRKLRAARTGEIANPDFLAGLIGDGRPLLRYLARAIADRSPAMTGLLDDMAAGAEDFLAASWPERYPPGEQRTRDAAVALVVQGMGSLVLYEYVAGRMGLSPQDPSFTPRLGLAQLDVYEAFGEYFSTGVGTRIREAAAEWLTTKEPH
jgi:AcrR family transcriptional regulator